MFGPRIAQPKPDRRMSFSSFAAWFQRGNPRAVAGGLYRKSDYGVWAETLNPLRGLTAARAQDIFDRARRGVYAELTYLYQEIEGADPTLFVCCERREAATSAADWRIITATPEKTPDWEDNLAAEQKDYLNSAYGAAGDEIGAVAEHLSRGFFRGFAHARPVYERDRLAGFEMFDPWNFARDPATGAWWWNPDAATSANYRFELIPRGELVTLERSRHIDFPALAIFIRAALGEKKWGIFLERYGIPPVSIIMPEFADKSEEAAYMEAAEKVARGGSGALPYGAQVSYATEARGTDPFTDFLRHQQEHIVMLATGGLLTTLAAPGSGTLAGNAHEQTWRAVVARDIRVVARALNRSVTRRLLAAQFPGRPALALLDLDPTPAPSASEVFEDAGKAKAAGYLVDREDLENRTGYKLIDLPEIAPQMPYYGQIPASNKQDPVAKRRFPVAKLTTGAAPNKGTAPRKAPEKAVSGSSKAVSPDPVAAALAAIEKGASVDEALDAYDAAAAAVLTPDVIAAQAEAVAEELEAAAAAGKEGN